MGRYIYKGISVREVRRALADEIPSNPALVRLIEDAAGGRMIAFLGEVSMKGHGSDRNIAFETFDDQAGRIWLDVPIDELRRGDISRFVADADPVIARQFSGSKRRITMAPSIWFQHQGNAESAVNPLTFEAVQEVASPTLCLALGRGIGRARDVFRELRRPPRPVPYWVMAQRW